jgi:hypothetical protein
MNFIFHDSRLFSDIDETHCDELFKIVKDKFLDKQYIANCLAKFQHTIFWIISQYLNVVYS